MVAACQDKRNSEGESASKILEKPPFASITDSIRAFPKNASLYLRRAELLSQTNNHQIAFFDYQKAWFLDAQEQTAMLFASNLSILGMNKQRLKLLDECIIKFPDAPDFKRLLGETYAELGQSKLALDLYQSMLSRDSTDFETWYEKGLLMESMADTPAAIKAIGKAYTLKPLNLYAFELAHLYAESGNDEALRICDKIIEEDKMRELVDPFFIKGIYYSNVGKYPNAINQFDSCIRRDWKYIDAYIEKGIAFFKQKSYAEALATFRMASTVSNTNPDAYFWAGRCYEMFKKNEDAVINYERALALDHNFTEARDALNKLRP
jgi:tetratricopeptide (TPR) repeat protein